MHCLIAVEEGIASTIRDNLQKMNSFSDWTFDACIDSNAIKNWSGKGIDVLALSRFLPGSDQVRLLPQLKMLFPTAHIVLLVGQVTESCRAYMRAAAGAGLHNTVTGKLPGDRPYTLMVALTRAKKPELDGYEDMGDVGAEEDAEACMNNVLEERDDLDEEPEEALFISNDRSEILRRHALRSTNPGVLVISTANKGGVGKTTTAIAVATALASISTGLSVLKLN